MAAGLWINDGVSQFSSEHYTGRNYGLLIIPAGAANTSGFVDVGPREPGELVYGILTLNGAADRMSVDIVNTSNVADPNGGRVLWRRLTNNASGHLMYGVY
ncbi:MAG: hypothetical protein WCY11_02500 [Novosphingobium sp.]